MPPSHCATLAAVSVRQTASVFLVLPLRRRRASSVPMLADQSARGGTRTRTSCMVWIRCGLVLQHTVDVQEWA